MAKETAEQKLLRLIEQGDSSGSSSPSDSAGSSAADPQQVLNAVQSVGGSFALPSFLSNLIGLFKGSFLHTPGQGFGVREINRILITVVGVVAMVFAAHLWRGMTEAKKAVVFDQLASASFSSKNFLPQFADVKEYVSDVSTRNIFHPFEKKEEPVDETNAAVVVKKISNQTKNLRLVGVSWLDTPDSASAMVENSENKVTYFLHAGEKVNGVTVEAIYADSIVLEFAGERMELKL